MRNCSIHEYIIILIIVFTTLVGCENKNSHKIFLGLNERYNLDTLSSSLASLDSNNIKSITTENVYRTILEWSDSLKSKWFLKKLSNNLRDDGNGIFEITKHNDSIIVLSLGEEDIIVGATNGYIFLLGYPFKSQDLIQLLCEFLHRNK